MKKLNYILSLLLLFVGFSCVDNIDEPFPEYDDLEKGAFARLLDGPNGTFDLFNIDGSSVSFTVEFYDENNGRNVAAYEWSVKFIDRANSGANTTDLVPLETVNASAFGTSPDGLPSTTLTFTFNEVLSTLGFTRDDINGGDQFEFQGVVVKTNGKRFSSANTGPNVIASAPFSGFFQFRQNIICPSDLGGEYSVYTVYDQHDFLPDFPENTMDMTVEKVGDASYKVSDFSGGLYSVGPYSSGYGTTGLEVTFGDACGNITFAGQTDPWQNLNPNPDQPSFVDPATGVLTISPVGSVYGEKWVSTYTPK